MDEDTDIDMEELAQRLSIELPIEAVLREWEKPLETLSDVVRRLDWVRQKQTSNTPL
jgi:hypothetical protein